MAHHALGRTYRDPTEQLANCFALGCVVERSSGPMRIDVIDRIGRKPRARERPLHCLSRSSAGRIRLREMEVISRDAVADYFCQNGRAARLGGLEILQSKNGRTFSQDHPSALSIERATFLGGRSLQRIEADKNQLRERVIPTG